MKLQLGIVALRFHPPAEKNLNEKKSEKNRAANKLTFDKQFISHTLPVDPSQFHQPSPASPSLPSRETSVSSFWSCIFIHILCPNEGHTEQNTCKMEMRCKWLLRQSTCTYEFCFSCTDDLPNKLNVFLLHYKTMSSAFTSHIHTAVGRPFACASIDHLSRFQNSSPTCPAATRVATKIGHWLIGCCYASAKIHLDRHTLYYNN